MDYLLPVHLQLGKNPEQNQKIFRFTEEMIHQNPQEVFHKILIAIKEHAPKLFEQKNLSKVLTFNFENSHFHSSIYTGLTIPNIMKNSFTLSLINLGIKFGSSFHM